MKKRRMSDNKEERMSENEEEDGTSDDRISKIQTPMVSVSKLQKPPNSRAGGRYSVLGADFVEAPSFGKKEDASQKILGFFVFFF
jgi:hypothetical protein